MEDLNDVERKANQQNDDTSDSGAESDGGSDSDFDDSKDNDPLVPLTEDFCEVTFEYSDEEVIYQDDAKLFRFDNTQTPHGWKERCAGKIQLLKHSTRETIRLVMRRNFTYEICANHYILSTMNLREHNGSDRAYVWWTPADFATGTSKAETFALRFKDFVDAVSFSVGFEEAKLAMKAYEMRQEYIAQKQTKQTEKGQDGCSPPKKQRLDTEGELEA